ncbi:MAG: type IX secretion system protein PorQ [Prevotella sp.]|nr:type IX secretion system protein PorQ [Prevotella sp.]
MKKVVFTIIATIFALQAVAQESQEVFSFLRLPVSAHVAALGGDNITIDDDDPTVIFHNPALIANVADKSINLNFMTYMEGAKTASASFIKAWGERATWGVGAQYMDYGSMKETTVDNIEQGTFSAKDIAIAGTFTYLLSDRWSGGVTLRFISSSIGSYNSIGLASDLGLNYFDEERGWSLSAVAKNLGGQVKAYQDDYEKIPIDLLVGVSKRLEAAPLRFSLTFSRLNRWDTSFIQHVAIGADVFLGENIYIAGGYNFRRRDEMRISESSGSSSHGAGLSVGAGLTLKRFKLNVAYAKYHVSASSILINATYSL